MKTPAQVDAANRRVPALMGMAEVAETLGINAKNLGKVQGLPTPALKLGCGRLWRADVIEEFAANRKSSSNGRSKDRS